MTLPMRQRALVLDANLLLLLVIGSIDTTWISRFKKTACFSAHQYERLTDIVSRFGHLVVTPHLLTEVSNLANDLRDDWKDHFTVVFREWITRLEEKHTPAKVLADHPMFRFGIADVSMLDLAAFVLILTQDTRFSSMMAKSTEVLAIDLATAIALGDDVFCV